MKMKVAACQILTFPSPKDSADKMIFWMEKASEDSVDVISFPEAALCCYCCDPEYWKQADPQDFREAEDRIAAAAGKLNLAVILGTVTWGNDGLYNSLLIIDRDGSIKGRYSKTHLAEKWCLPGRQLPVYTVAGVKSCFIICHDVRYPELVRLPVINGARICYFCSNESGLMHENKLSAYRAMPIARATENDIFLVMANAPANAKDLQSKSQSHGNSKIIHPDGNVICEAGYFNEGLISAVIDMDEAKGSFALRSASDETILAKWMGNGAELVNN